MARIHPSAQVAAGARLDDDVEIGPLAVIGPRVTLGAGSRIGSHVVIDGRTTLGRNNVVHAHAVLGGPPQDKKYAGEDTALIIGDDNTIREFCTFSTGTVQGGGTTRVGSRNWVMAYVHVAHDCIVGDDCVLANTATLGGHVEVGDWAILGGMCAVHQFVRIGAHAFVGGGSMMVQDLPPYTMCQGYPAQPRGINVEGLKRRGFDAESIALLRRAFKLLYRDNLGAAEAVAAIEALARDEAQTDAQRQPLLLLAQFVASSTRGIMR
ncbi:MAG: acyl-ACP--UDP-N-acetylglucosamine O-acyltransferase [Betaproteobacteria bacterium]